VEEKPRIQAIYPLSPMQEGMLFHSLLDKDSSVYVQQMDFTINSHLHVDIVEKSLNMLIERYDIFRTIFLHENLQRPQQVVIKKRTTSIIYEDISALTVMEQEKFIKSFKQKDIKRGFNLQKDVLLRISILKRAEHKYTIIWSNHHIILDGWCMGGVIQEFFRIYLAKKSGMELQLDETPQYGKYIRWLEQYDKKEAKQYWLKYLTGYSQKVSVPNRTNCNTIAPYQQEQVTFSLERKQTQALTNLAIKLQVTPNTIVQGIWGIILKNYNHTQDIVFGTVVSGRPVEIPNIEKMVGLFINTIPVRIQLNEISFADLVQKVQQTAFESEKYNVYPLVEIQANSPLKQDLFDHILIFESLMMKSDAKLLAQEDQTAIDKDDIHGFEQTNYNLNIMVELGDEINVRITYNTHIYDRKILENIGGHFKKILEAVVKNPKIFVEQIDILTQPERKQILYDFNHTKVSYDKDKLIYELFEDRVRQSPNQTAVIYKNKTYTYKELNQTADQIARRLRQAGVRPNHIVGLMVQRTVNMLTGLLGILKAGGAYLPIDPNYPKERIDYMLSASQTLILLSQSKLVEQLKFEGEIIDIELLESANEGDDQPAPEMKASDLAYLIYTSGSTGKPKGVMIEHQAVVNFIQSMTSKIAFHEHKTILNLTTISFDIFVLESLVPLTQGLTVVIADEEEQMDPRQLRNCIRQYQVDMLQATPSRMQMLIDSGKDLSYLSHVKEIMVGGEAFPPSLLKELQKITGVRIYNMYGPTETTVWSTVQELTDLKQVNIGKPIANTQIYILNQLLFPVPIGVCGELYIAGDGVARGYFNQSELTLERFVINPFAIRTRMYQTGDLARWLPDGTIECIGRVDNQVKIRGYRVEIEEIEAVLMQHERVHMAAVAVFDDEAGSKYLCGYITADGEVPPEHLQGFLSERLPDYMIPSYFVKLDQIPQTPNGKVDRKALPRWDGTRQASAAYDAPADDVEEKLAHIFSEVLGSDKVGRQDNFYALGGHSLKTTTLQRKILEQFDVELALKEIYNNPKVSTLAEYIKKMKEQNHKPLDSNVILLKKSEKQAQNIFMIHGGSGHAEVYLKLVALLPDQFNYWGINANKLAGYAPNEVNIAAVASEYINKIKQIKAQGPYHICGWSIGGSIAFEVVRQLEECGEKVDFLILIDAAATQPEEIGSHIEFSLDMEKSIARKIIPLVEIADLIAAQQTPEDVWQNIINYLEQSKNKQEKLDRIKASMPKEARSIIPQFDQAKIADLIYYTNLMRSYINARADYIPANKIKTQVHFIHPNLDSNVREEIWNNYCEDEIIVYNIEGDHFSIFEEPFVNKHARIIKKILKNYII
jgi:amino acid adenylation domain-containing protein